jgi:hypothetical protein
MAEPCQRQLDNREFAERSFEDRLGLLVDVEWTHREQRSQVPVKGWHELIGEPTLADAICDRLVHNAYVIKLDGSSLRDPASRERGAATSGSHAAAPPKEPGRRTRQ